MERSYHSNMFKIIVEIRGTEDGKTQYKMEMNLSQKEAWKFIKASADLQYKAIEEKVKDK